ncbi:MAG: HD domain-containing protein [Spirochaetales bacterium]|nr:HD domain-containing protein [Spirochaetales bacterium]MCF7939357.1 HD domain-containing protein [Spirochaetales bacterium]
MSSLNELLGLFETIDGERSVTEKLKRLHSWSVESPEVYDTRMICFDSIDLGEEQEFAYIAPAKDTGLFPTEPSIINGHSPLPPHLFPEEVRKHVSVYYPFFNPGGELQGALLIKARDPKKYLKSRQETLGMIASKSRDILEIASLRKRIRPQKSTENTALSPDLMFKVLDMLQLPLYVMDRNGRFLSVNRTFLDTFSYIDLREVNKTGNFFIDQEDWGRSILELAEMNGSQGYTSRVRTGTGSIKVVKDFSITMGQNTMGILFDITSSVQINEQLQESLDSQTELNRKLMSTSSNLKKTQATTIKSLANLAEYRDMETGDHLHRICEYNRVLTSQVYKHQPYVFNISEDYVDDIYFSGMLHDIGKVAVPDSILLKNDSLDTQEWGVMQKHTRWGWSILNDADRELGEQSFLTLATRIALSHHERWDGSGYPEKLGGDDIPLSARITAVADVYDALTSRRPYKDPWPHERAMEEIRSLSGSHFDPVLIELLGSVEDDFFMIRQNSVN